MALTMKNIQNALDHLGRLRPARLNLSAKRDFSLREAVLFMAPKLTEMKELGFSSRELAAALAEREIAIKVPTLNRYLSEYQSGREKEVAAEAVAADPPEVKAGPPDESATVPPAASGRSEPDSEGRPEASAIDPEDSGEPDTDHEQTESDNR
jgi:hypothetical protein